MTRTITILLLALGIILTGCQFAPSSEDPAQQQDAIQLSRKQKMQEQIDRRYENPEAHYQLGKLYHEEGQLDKADFQYRVALGFDPIHYRAQAGVVKVLSDLQQTEREQIVAEIYISQTAVSAENSIKLGKAFQNEGLGEFAVSCYFQAAGLEPESPKPFRLLGFYYLAEGDEIRAEEHLRRSFELDPYQADVSGALGRMGVIIGLPRKAGVISPPASVE